MKPLALEDLEVALRKLEAAPYRIPIGIGGRASVDSVLRLRDDWRSEPERLVRVIASVLAADPEEVEAVTEVLGRSLRPEPSAPRSGAVAFESQPATDPDSAPPPGPTPSPTRRGRPFAFAGWRRGVAVGLGVLFLVGVGFAVPRWMGNGPERPDEGDAVSDEGNAVSDAEILARCPERPDEVVARGMYRVPVRAARALPPVTDPRPGLALGLGAALVFIALAAIIRRYTRLDDAPPRSEPTPDDRATAAPRPTPPPIGELFTPQEQGRIAAGAGRWTSEAPSRSIDLRRSVARASASVEPCAPVFKPMRVERSLWIWSHDREHDALHYAVVAQVAEVLRAHRAPMRRLRGRTLTAPDELVDPDHNEWVPRDLDVLSADAVSAAVMLFTHAGALFQKSGRLRPGTEGALRRFAGWPRFALVDVSRSDDVARWAEEVQVPYLVPEGLPRWLERAHAEDGAPVASHVLSTWKAILRSLEVELRLTEKIALLEALRRSDDPVAPRLAGLRPLNAAYVRADAAAEAGAPEDRTVIRQARDWWAAQLNRAADEAQQQDPGWLNTVAAHQHSLERLLYDLRSRNMTVAAVDDLMPAVVGAVRRAQDPDAVRAALPDVDTPSAQASSDRSRAVLAALREGRSRLPTPSLAGLALAVVGGIAVGATGQGVRALTDGTVPIQEGPTLEMVVLPGGTFCMGSPEKEVRRYVDERLHLVGVSDFAIGRTEVTVAQYEAWRTKTATGAQAVDGETPRHPATDITWKEARDFCRTYGLDLPTEAQWEYAARGGRQTAFAFGDDPSALPQYANNGDTAEAVAQRKAAPRTGLFDMHGNVWEWTLDWYQRDISGNPLTLKRDPKGPPAGFRRVVRGGSFVFQARALRSANRDWWPPGRPATRSRAFVVRVLRVASSSRWPLIPCNPQAVMSFTRHDKGRLLRDSGGCGAARSDAPPNPVRNYAR